MFSSLFGNATAEKALLYIANYGEGHARAIATNFHLSASQVSLQLHRLEEGGILVSKTVGKTKVFIINPRLGIKNSLLELLENILRLMDESEKQKYYRQRTRPRKTGKSL